MQLEQADPEQFSEASIQTSADLGQRAPQEKMAERSHRDLQGLVLESLGTISGFCCELSYLPRAPQFCHLS